MKNQMIALMKTKKNNKNIISSKSVIKYKSMLPTKYLLLTEKKNHLKPADKSSGKSADCFYTTKTKMEPKH